MKNSKGTVYYGMHFYPGVAEYQEPGKEPFRVLLNEDTIRAMDPSFAGRPVFVEHVEDVEPNIDALRKEADGWVTESFYNQADGKHWVKFIVVSERGERAIKNGMRLSNCYRPEKYAGGGQWNGVSYAKEIVGGEYEHLAIVRNPRYAESIILTPEEFKKYNEDHVLELTRLANSTEEPGTMKLNLFKRAKVENAADLEGLSVVLPKSGREMTIVQIVNELDELETKKKEPQMANSEHLVDVGGTKMTLNELVAKHQAMCDELEAMKKKNVDDPDEDGDPGHGDVDMSTADVMNEDEDEEKKKADEEKTKNELEVARKAKEKADRLRNAGPTKGTEQVARVEFSQDQVARGKARYGS